MRKVLIPVDCSGYSEAALDWALENVLRKDGSDQVTLLHVSRVVASGSGEELYSEYPVVNPVAFVQKQNGVPNGDSADEVHMAAEKFLRPLVQKLKEGGVPEECIVTAVFPEGASDNWVVGRHIVEHVQKHGNDMVILGTRGLTAVQAKLYGAIGLGSVSDHVVRKVSCAVALVHQQKEAVDTSGLRSSKTA